MHLVVSSRCAFCTRHTLTPKTFGTGCAGGEWRSTFSQLTLPAASEGFVHVSVVSSDVELYAQLNYLAALPSPPLLPSPSPPRSRTSPRPQHFPGNASPTACPQRSPQRSPATHEGAAAAHPASTSWPVLPTAEAYMPGGSAQAARQAVADASVDDSRDGDAGVCWLHALSVCFTAGSSWLSSTRTVRRRFESNTISARLGVVQWDVHTAHSCPGLAGERGVCMAGQRPRRVSGHVRR